MSNTITIEELMTYGMWAEFLHGLQNYRYPQISVGGSGFARNGVDYTANNINQVLAGEYNGSFTRPLLNQGIGNGTQSLPLGMFKDVRTDSNVPGLDGWLRTFRSLLIDNTRDYPPGGEPDGNSWRLNDGATTMYLAGYPYISVNPLKKSGQWLNLNSQPNPPTQYSISGVNDALNNKGAQYTLFSHGSSDTSKLTFENATLEPGYGRSTPIKLQSPRGPGVSTSFTYIPGSGSQSLEISKELTTELTTQQTQGTRYKHSESLSNTFKFSNTFKSGLSIDVPEVGKASEENSTTIENTTQASFAQENEISASNQKTTKTTEKNTIKYSFNPGAFKENSSIANLGTLTGEAKLKDPNQTLISGERYRASFIYNTASVSIPGNGYQTIYGTAAPIEPRSMQYQALNPDMGTVNWFERSDTTPDGRLVGKQASFIAQKFLDFAGNKAYGIEDITNVTKSDGTKEEIQTFRFNSDSSFSSLAVVDTTTDISFNILLDISKEHSSADRLAGQFSNALQVTTGSPLDNVYDLEANGQTNMSESYIGDAGSDVISGTIEGDDYAHTDSGDDVIVGFNNSFIDSGDGNDIISMGSKDSQNFIDAGNGDDILTLESTGNVVDLGLGADTATVITGNSIDLGLDRDTDTLTINPITSSNGQNIYIENLDLGSDLIFGASERNLNFAYDSLYNLIISRNENSGQEFVAWIHPNEDLNINLNEHRLFLQLISSSDLTAADRVFIETESLSEAQWDAFIERFVFSDQQPSNQPLNTADAQSNAFMAADLKELLNNPDLQSLGRAIWKAASSAAESALKPLITAKLVDLGIPETAATDVVNSSWAIVVGLLEQSVTDANALATPSDSMFSSAADTFLIEVSSRMEESFHAQAFPTEQIDPLTGLAITPSADDNTITGTDSNDWIRAGSGEDQIDSGAGNDAVRAGTGSDQISLGAGSDALIISYDQMDGATDTVTDFNAAEDRLLLEDGIQIEQLSGDRFRLFTNGNLGEEERELTLLLESGGADLATLNIERFSFG